VEKPDFVRPVVYGYNKYLLEQSTRQFGSISAISSYIEVYLNRGKGRVIVGLCCERYVQNVTNFIAHKPVNKPNAEIPHNFIS